MGEWFSQYKYILMGFNYEQKKKYHIFCSNKVNLANTQKKNEIVFINYDYKNELESFKVNKNNPLQFQNQIFAEVEKQLTLKELPNISESKTTHKINIISTVSKDDYVTKVNLLKKHIQNGDIYEINYCITFEAKEIEINPLTIFKKLNEISEAPYACLAKFDKQYIISSSPELYISKKGNVLTTKPIKGTAKRGKTNAEDHDLKTDLQNSLKEKTENVMIVDVCRNDLSRLAKKGTVVVEKLYDIESYKQVHQMVSTVKCELKENTSFKEIINSTFPMASMTGAPKIKAMQLIDDYELYNRGPYSGCIGYIDGIGDFELSVLIRSIFYDEEKRYLSFSVGSAITAMSNAEDEYEECLLKAKAMIQVLST